MGAERKGHNWTSTVTTDGVRDIHCDDWSGFTDFINNALVDFNNYVFRGQAHEDWELEPTLDRYIRDNGLTDSQTLRLDHLNAFKYAIRGRRARNSSTVMTENECWCIGQHYGLATPLLDWTESPYAAAYFAFATPTPQSDPSQSRVVFALQRATVKKKCESLKKEGAITDEQGLTFVHPTTDENSRMISQRGLFTRAPKNTTIENWVKKHFKDDNGGSKLIRIFVPDVGRLHVLKSLNRMNVNHLSLFPDMYGSAKYCNMALGIKAYAPVPERI